MNKNRVLTWQNGQGRAWILIKFSSSQGVMLLLWQPFTIYPARSIKYLTVVQNYVDIWEKAEKDPLLAVGKALKLGTGRGEDCLFIVIT